ncbi:MAG: SAM-dependent methyltransferase [Candidatus Puniceispirillum sp.]|nr:SAM-dependent methyltransferase [Candidatus Puniceispirillum sp.]
MFLDAWGTGTLGFKKISGVSPMSSSLVAAAAVTSLLSHGFDTSIETHRARISTATDLSYGREETLSLLDELSTFESGRFLLKNQGLDGEWISYLILDAPLREDLCPLEHWMVHRAPSALATRARFWIFQEVMTARLQDNMRIASVPCGLMEDLLHLPTQGLANIALVGIDLDENALKMAAENAQSKGFHNASFIQKDAWDLGEENAYDLLTSSGLNIYVTDPVRHEALFESFFKALKPGAVLVSSFWTPPPALNPASPWVDVDPQDALKQKVVFKDIIGAKWQNFDMPGTITAQLTRIGYKDIQILPDPNWIMPTVVATKP